MNKRQKKKLFKRIHGYNPPKKTKPALKMIAIFIGVVLLEGWLVFTTAEIVKNIETILKYLGITPPIKNAWEKWERARKKRKAERERARKDREYREAVEKIIEDWRKKENE